MSNIAKLIERNKTLRPTQCNNIVALDKTGYVKPSSGAWYILVPLIEVNESWRIVKEATECGKLGLMSSVTPAQNEFKWLTGSGVYLIRVAVYFKDALSVKACLRDVGIKQNAAYILHGTRINPSMLSHGLGADYWE